MHIDFTKILYVSNIIPNIISTILFSPIRMCKCSKDINILTFRR